MIAAVGREISLLTSELLTEPPKQKNFYRDDGNLIRLPPPIEVSGDKDLLVFFRLAAYWIDQDWLSTGMLVEMI